jgi:AbrB family looped-hinge helix DNA binding protein
MAQHLTVVTRKGQITIPVEIRRALDLKEGDKVEVTLEDGHARLSPYGSVTARTAGMFRGEGPPLSAEELREAAERAMAEIAIERMGG